VRYSLGNPRGTISVGTGSPLIKRPGNRAKGGTTDPRQCGPQEKKRVMSGSVSSAQNRRWDENRVENSDKKKSQRGQRCGSPSNIQGLAVWRRKGKTKGTSATKKKRKDEASPRQAKKH